MSTLPSFVRAIGDNSWRLSIKVQPGAKVDTFVVRSYHGALNIRLGVPAVKGKANKALINFIAGRLELKKKQIQLEIGQFCRNKILLVVSQIEPRWELFFSGAVGMNSNERR